MKKFIAFVLMVSTTLAFASPVSPEQQLSILQAINESLQVKDLSCKDITTRVETPTTFMASTVDFTTYKDAQMNVNEENQPPKIEVNFPSGENQSVQVVFTLSENLEKVTMITASTIEKTVRRVNRGTITRPDMKEEVVTKATETVVCK